MQSKAEMRKMKDKIFKKICKPMEQIQFILIVKNCLMHMYHIQFCNVKCSALCIDIKKS